MENKFKDINEFIKKQFPNKDFIPLHEPVFIGNEKEYLNQCIDSTFVSSTGQFVNEFEQKIAQYTGAKYAVATTNGTSALHISLLLAGVKDGDEVITQALTFIATCNAITYCNAKPIFVDVDRSTLGLSDTILRKFLEENAEIRDGECINKLTGNRIKACVPMHTFGHPCKIDKILSICNEYKISLIEDAAESLGSYYKEKHTGTYGKLGVLSFNGNKIITSGGGGCIITDDEELAKKAKHITTTAKIPHNWEYKHDLIGYNYRLPNINAALLCAQLEKLPLFLKSKRELAVIYKSFFSGIGISFIDEPENSQSNFWLDGLIMEDGESRNAFLEYMNTNGVMARPIWELMTGLELFKGCQKTDLSNSEYLADRVVNIPSSVRVDQL